MKKTFAATLLVMLLLTHVFLLGRTAQEAKALPQADMPYPVPAPLIKLLAFGFKGIVADQLFLKSLVFIGSTMERTERPRVRPAEWKWLYALVDSSTNLDPYFYDPYYFANANFTWDGKMIVETNKLLEKGSRYRDWDSTLPFFMAFNSFYFLGDNDSARSYLLEASKRPGAPFWFADLAARLSYSQKRTENAISFLEELVRRTDDEQLRKRYEERLSYLRSVLRREEAAKQYKRRFGKEPSRMDDLVTKGLIPGLPVDPFGGSLYQNPDEAAGASRNIP